MNLRDLERMTQAMFGDCPGCGDCNTCRALGIVTMAWETGRRSGSASAADRSVKHVRWDEWNWTTAQLELIEYMKASECFDTASRNFLPFIEQSMEEAEQWAKSKSVKRADWTMFMKSWLRRRAPAPVSPQADLFGESSPRSSEVSALQTNRKQARSAAAMRLLKGGKS